GEFFDRRAVIGDDAPVGRDASLARSGVLFGGFGGDADENPSGDGTRELYPGGTGKLATKLLLRNHLAARDFADRGVHVHRTRDQHTADAIALLHLGRNGDYFRGVTVIEL